MQIPHVNQQLPLLALRRSSWVTPPTDTQSRRYREDKRGPPRPIMKFLGQPSHPIRNYPAPSPTPTAHPLICLATLTSTTRSRLTSSMTHQSQSAGPTAPGRHRPFNSASMTAFEPGPDRFIQLSCISTPCGQHRPPLRHSPTPPQSRRSTASSVELSVCSSIGCTVVPSTHRFDKRRQDRPRARPHVADVLLRCCGVGLGSGLSGLILACRGNAVVLSLLLLLLLVLPNPEPEGACLAIVIQRTGVKRLLCLSPCTYAASSLLLWGHVLTSKQSFGKAATEANKACLSPSSKLAIRLFAQHHGVALERYWEGSSWLHS